MQSIITNIPIALPNKYRQLQYKSGTLYYLRLEFNGNNDTNNAKGKTGSKAACKVLYKLGYTTAPLLERVYGKPAAYIWGKGKNNKGKRMRVVGHNGMGLPANTQVYVIATYHINNASLIYQYEQYLHNKHRNSRYNGLPVMENGNTELYITDILGLDN